MTQTATFSIGSSELGLTRYLEEVRGFPMLQRQEEYNLAKRWREHDDRNAAHKLVTSHLRLVAKLAMGYRGYGLRPDQVVTIGRHLGVGEQDVIVMNRRLSGDVSLDATDSGRRGCGRVAGLAG